MTIRTRLLLLTIGLVVPLMLVGLYNQWQAWDTSRTMLNASTEQQAKLAATAFEQWVSAQSQTLLAISHIGGAQSAGEYTLRDYLNSVIKTHPTWLNIEIVDPLGNIIVRQTIKKWNVEAATVDTLRNEAEQKGSLVIIAEQISEKQLRMLSMALPMPDGNLIIARIDGTSASEVFNQLQLPENHIIAVFDENNQLIYRNSQDSPDLLTMDISQTSFYKALSGKRTGIIEVDSPYDHIARIYGLARVEPIDAVVAVGVPRADLYDRATEQFYEQVLLSLLIATLAVFAAFLIANSVVGPLKQLTDVARELGEGNLTVRTHLEDNAAVGKLGESFDMMAQRIEAREDKLKELDHLKSDFVSSVSHELRTPLTTIKTLVRVLETNNIKQNQHDEYLRMIGSECDRQIELVQNLLDLSRLESGAYRPVVSKTNAVDILRDVVSVHQSNAQSRAIMLELVLPEEPLPTIKADPAAFRRIISSMIENSFKYTPDGGRVTIIGGRLGSDVVIEITDTGCGIAREDLTRIFEKFYRGRPLSASAMINNENPIGSNACVTVEPKPGIGLGLYLVKTLIYQMGGKIEVKSPVSNNIGTSFAIRFPIFE
jgi:signal transduction histidine kinase